MCDDSSHTSNNLIILHKEDKQRLPTKEFGSVRKLIPTSAPITSSTGTLHPVCDNENIYISKLSNRYFTNK